jgi:hypothetical protein
MKFFPLLTGMIVGMALLLGIMGYETPVSSYNQEGPNTLDIKHYFNGPLTAYGVVHNWYGKATHRFTSHFNGSWDQNQGTLKENRHYEDGNTTLITWNITRHNDHHFSVTSEEISEVAHGAQYGTTMNMRYTKTTDMKGQPFLASMSHWFYQLEPTRLMSTMVLRKYWVPVSRTEMFMVKEGASAVTLQAPAEAVPSAIVLPDMPD